MFRRNTHSHFIVIYIYINLSMHICYKIALVETFPRYLKENKKKKKRLGLISEWKREIWLINCLILEIGFNKLFDVPECWYWLVQVFFCSQNFELINSYSKFFIIYVKNLNYKLIIQTIHVKLLFRVPETNKIANKTNTYFP